MTVDGLFVRHDATGGENLQPNESASGQQARAALDVSKPSSGDNVRLGVAAILATTLAMSLGEAAVKLLSSDFVLWQIFVLRSCIGIPILIAVIRLRSRITSLVPLRIGWVALRSSMLALWWVAYYAALPHLTLAIAAAALYTLPLFITLFAAAFVGDRIGLKGWSAISLGFVGVLLILKPDAGGFNAYALLPLLAAVLDAFAMILTRTKCRGENPLVLALSLNFVFVCVGFLATILVGIFGTADSSLGGSFIFGDWTPMGSGEWLSMGLLAVASVIASSGVALAYQVGPPATIATFDFTYVGLCCALGHPDLFRGPQRHDDRWNGADRRGRHHGRAALGSHSASPASRPQLPATQRRLSRAARSPPARSAV